MYRTLLSNVEEKKNFHFIGISKGTEEKDPDP